MEVVIGGCNMASKLLLVAHNTGELGAGKLKFSGLSSAGKSS